MRKVYLPWMWRHIGAFGHEAHVAQRAGFGDFGEIFGLDAVHVFGRAAVDQLEQPREGIAQIEAAPATMADIENPPHLGIQQCRVMEIGILPSNRMTGRSLKAAFARHWFCGNQWRKGDLARRSPENKTGGYFPSVSSAFWNLPT